MKSKEEIKKEIYKISAFTDRGQRLNKLIAPIYEEELLKMELLVNSLGTYKKEINKEALSGDWELIFASVELFRSSPFFLSIEKALNNKIKSDLFFKLHQLQVGSFGLSTIGRITQSIDFSKKEIISNFDTTIFGLTVFPLFGWFKILPTFGGRVITLADNIFLEEERITMTLQKTKVTEVKGLNKIPLFSNLLMDRWFPVNDIWKLLPWNNEEPSCFISIIYVDEDLRITRDTYGSLFIYIRP